MPKSRPQLTLRPAEPSDARLLFRWANDRGARAASFNSAPIAWETHRAWFAARLTTPKRTRIYIALDPARQPAGQVRFEKRARARAIISIVVAADHRQRGVGSALIKLGCKRAAKDLGVLRVLAYIRADNLASIGAFARAGFVHLRRVTMGGAPSVLMIWTGPPS